MDRFAAPKGGRHGKVGRGKSNNTTFKSTELCKFFQMNNCSRGRDCNFAHNLGDLKEKPDLWKTKLCADFMMSGACRSAELCRFAHGKGQLRSEEPQGNAASSSSPKEDTNSLAASHVQGEHHGVLRQHTRSHHGNQDVVRLGVCPRGSSSNNQARGIWSASGSTVGKANGPLLQGNSSDNQGRSSRNAFGSTVGSARGPPVHGTHGLALAQHLGIDMLSGRPGPSTPSGVNNQVQREQLASQNTLVSNGSIACGAPSCSWAVHGHQELASPSHGMSVGGFQACQNLDLRQHEDLHAALLGQGLELPQGLSSQVLGQLQSLYISKQVEILSAAIASLEGAMVNTTTEAASSDTTVRATGLLQQQDVNSVSSSPGVADAYTPGLVRTASTALNDSILHDNDSNEENSTQGTIASFSRQNSHESSAVGDGAGDGPLFMRQRTEPPIGSRRNQEQQAEIRRVVVRNTFIDVYEESAHTTLHGRRSSSAPPVCTGESRREAPALLSSRSESNSS